jgi:hypothetical protein
MMNLQRTTFILAAACTFVSQVMADAPPTQPFEAVQVKGDVRVVLVSVARSVRFSAEGFRTTNSVVHAIPGLEVTYLVEALGSSKSLKWVTQTSEVYADGKRIIDLPGNLAAGGSSGISEYRALPDAEKPSVSNPKRTVVHKEWLRGVKIPGKRMDLHIVTGFNEQKENFVFKEIPLE